MDALHLVALLPGAGVGGRRAVGLRALGRAGFALAGAEAQRRRLRAAGQHGQHVRREAHARAQGEEAEAIRKAQPRHADGIDAHMRAGKVVVALRDAHQAKGQKKLALPSAGQADAQGERRDGQRQGQEGAERVAAFAPARDLRGSQLLGDATERTRKQHAKKRDEKANERRAAQQKRAAAGDGERGDEHQRAEEQRVQPARGHLSLTGICTPAISSPSACWGVKPRMRASAESTKRWHSTLAAMRCTSSGMM